MLHPIKTHSDVKVGDKIFKKGSSLDNLYTIIAIDEKHPNYIFVKDFCEKPYRFYIADIGESHNKDVFQAYDFFKYDKIEDVKLAISMWHAKLAEYWRALGNDKEEISPEKEIMKAYNYVFGYVITYYNMFFRSQDRELPWAMVASIINQNTGRYYSGIGMSHLSESSKAGFEYFMKQHKKGLEAWSKFVESMR